MVTTSCRTSIFLQHCLQALNTLVTMPPVIRRSNFNHLHKFYQGRMIGMQDAEIAFRKVTNYHENKFPLAEPQSIGN